MSDAPKKTPDPATGAKSDGKSKGKGKFPLVALLIPVALIAAAVLLFTLPPTHAMLVNGPLKKFFPPGSAQSAKAVDPATQITQLNGQIASAKAAAAQKDQQITKLQAQLSAQASPAPGGAGATAAPAPSPTATVVPDDVKRVAKVWAEMDAENAAAVVAKLPVPYVKLVFSQMAPDAVAEIIDAVPAPLAALLTSDNP